MVKSIYYNIIGYDYLSIKKKYYLKCYWQYYIEIVWRRNHTDANGNHSDLEIMQT